MNKDHKFEFAVDVENCSLLEEELQNRWPFAKHVIYQLLHFNSLKSYLIDHYSSDMGKTVSVEKKIGIVSFLREGDRYSMAAWCFDNNIPVYNTQLRYIFPEPFLTADKWLWAGWHCKAKLPIGYTRRECIEWCENTFGSDAQYHTWGLINGYVVFTTSEQYALYMLTWS